MALTRLLFTDKQHLPTYIIQETSMIQGE